MDDNGKIVMNVLGIFPMIKEILNRRNLDIEDKGGIGNVVTKVDKDVESYITGELLMMFPDAQIIGEESVSKYDEGIDCTLKFIVDPIDGTTNYINNWPHTVSIGIVNDKQLIAGIIYDVLSNKVYTGISGFGVAESDINRVLDLKKVNRPVYSSDQIKKALICYDTPYGEEAYKVTQKMSAALYYAGASLKTVGPISLDVLKMALGKENRPNDYNAAVWHCEVRAWDLAAATCILRELGGDIIGEDGNPLTIETLTNPYEKICFIASGNEKLRSQLYAKYVTVQTIEKQNTQFNKSYIKK